MKIPQIYQLLSILKSCKSWVLERKKKKDDLKCKKKKRIRGYKSNGIAQTNPPAAAATITYTTMPDKQCQLQLFPT